MSARQAFARGTPPSIDGARLQIMLETLARYGRPAGGGFADGVSRTAYSDADLAGRDYAMALMRDAGLAVRIDTAGNIIGTRVASSRAPCSIPRACRSVLSRG